MNGSCLTWRRASKEASASRVLSISDWLSANVHEPELTADVDQESEVLDKS
jgi:hypothetical protein